MLKSEVKIGGVYVTTVGGKLTTVRIDSEVERRGYGPNTKTMTHWAATNLKTGRQVEIKSAAKLRREVTAEKPVASTPSPAAAKPVSLPKPAATPTKNHAPLAETDIIPKLNAKTIIVKEGEQLSKENMAELRAMYDGADKPLIPIAMKPGPAGRELLRKATETIAANPTNPKWKLSELLASQKSAQRETIDNAPHVIVEALAGTGKTTTLVAGLQVIRGQTPRDAKGRSIEPSPQQAAVWEAMKLSAGKVQSICFVAFNKSIATELQGRMPEGCSAMTLHSMGFKGVQRAFGRVAVDEYRVSNIIAEILDKDIRELRRDSPVLVKATQDLVSLCKQNLAGNDEVAKKYGDNTRSVTVTEEELDQLAAHYDVELNGSREKVFDLVPKVLERCKDIEKDRAIDFDDMIWLPIALNLPLYRYDLLLVDEAQDLNRCQQQLALRSGRRLILCGDRNQAIYGFAGADADSIPRMTELLSGTDRGCEVLPLTVTRRCGRNIVKEAQKIVPNFEAFETNGEGKIGSAIYEDNGTPNYYAHRVLSGDMILCRVNAPLISQCFRFLKSGKKATIQGRDIGKGLISTINKLKAIDVMDLMMKLEDWHAKEVAKVNAMKNPSEHKLIALEDRKLCLLAFCEEAVTITDVTDKISRVFTDGGDGIKLSSVHRAKGLEAKRVFILQPKGAEMPHPMAKSAWQRGQEMNILYVAITRAIEELVYVR